MMMEVEVLTMQVEVRKKAKHSFVAPNALPIDRYRFRDNVVGMALGETAWGESSNGTNGYNGWNYDKKGRALPSLP